MATVEQRRRDFRNDLKNFKHFNLLSCSKQVPLSSLSPARGRSLGQSGRVTIDFYGFVQYIRDIEMIYITVKLLKVTYEKKQDEFRRFFDERGWSQAEIWLKKAFHYRINSQNEWETQKKVLKKLLWIMGKCLGFMQRQISVETQSILQRISQSHDRGLRRLVAAFGERSLQLENPADNSSESESSADDGSRSEDGNQQSTRSGSQTSETRGQMPTMEQDSNPPTQEHLESNPYSPQGPSNENSTGGHPGFFDIATSPFWSGSSRSPNRSERPVNFSPGNLNENSPQSSHMGTTPRPERFWFRAQALPSMVFNGPTTIHINCHGPDSHSPRNLDFSQLGNYRHFPSQRRQV
ncbi:uncharacterized protein LOC141850920 [Brevipalpus obovatus]|uniref:uncharacterized protein LOC141850920 n=1 Tax=Brevipalpus obovatus TaxID=246614 RepID=UPI003D9F1801